ncbi:cysteine hydrolase family protein [Cryobacterium sp. Y62]|uniref:cysteine hydrolase family protein n=1 Tax=Cryobacterium sp. Y62 TaxID=2048284 RepID=UPI00130485B2|nr:cysteine hydrolase [Cryobacterium sp. Y62]
MSDALILIDLQFGLCKPGGVGSAGLAERVAENRTLENAAELLAAYRAAGKPVFHVRLGFEASFANRTNRTPRFDSHQKVGRFALGGADTKFCEEVTPLAGETILTKGSVGAFASTPLLAFLNGQNICDIAIAGIATHLAVESTAREAADRSLRVTVVADACTGPEALHDHSIGAVLPVFATVENLAEHLELVRS